jgi:hypothetical protein
MGGGLQNTLFFVAWLQGCRWEAQFPQKEPRTPPVGLSPPQYSILSLLQN